MKQWAGIGAAILILLSAALPVSAEVQQQPVGTVGSGLYHSYNYNLQGQSVPAPEAYIPTYEVSGADGDGWSAPTDLYVRDDRVYVLDAGNSRVVVLDKELQQVAEIRPAEAPSLAGLGPGRMALAHRTHPKRLEI